MLLQFHVGFESKPMLPNEPLDTTWAKYTMHTEERATNKQRQNTTIMSTTSCYIICHLRPYSLNTPRVPFVPKTQGTPRKERQMNKGTTY